MLEEKILKDYKAAMLAKDAAKSSILSFLRAQFQNLAKEKKKDKLEDKDAISIIKREVKRHQDSIEQFKKGNRQDLVDKETKELDILKSYLPKQLSEDELKKAIDEVVLSLGATDMKQMGQIMKEVMAKVGDSADGKMVSSLVKAKLTPAKEDKKE